MFDTKILMRCLVFYLILDWFDSYSTKHGFLTINLSSSSEDTVFRLSFGGDSYYSLSNTSRINERRLLTFNPIAFANTSVDDTGDIACLALPDRE